MTQWTPSLVEERLAEAASVLKRLPEVYLVVDCAERSFGADVVRHGAAQVVFKGLLCEPCKEISRESSKVGLCRKRRKIVLERF